MKQYWPAWIFIIFIYVCFRSQWLLFHGCQARHSTWTEDLLQPPLTLTPSVCCGWALSCAVKCIVVKVTGNITRQYLNFIMNLLRLAASPLISVWGHLKFIHWLLPQTTSLSYPKPRLLLTSPYNAAWLPQWTLVHLPLLYLLMWLRFMAFCLTHVLV